MSNIETTSTPNSDYEVVVRAMIKHENELMNHRITWLSTLQGLLFAALGFAWDKHDAQVLVFIISIIGIVISISSITVLRAASGAISDLADWWENNKPEDYQGPGVIGRRTTKSWQRLLYPWNLLPVLFTFAWLLVLAVYWYRANA